MKQRDHGQNDKEEQRHDEPAHGHGRAQANHPKEHHQQPHGQTHEHVPADPKHEAEKAPAALAAQHQHKTDAEKLKAAHAALAALNDQMLRLQADFDNFRKRTLREKNEIYQRANEDIMLELLPVLDHMELALITVDADEIKNAYPAVVDGLKLVAEQLASALKKFGLESVDAVGRPFDANKHESVSQMVSETVPEGGVLAQTRRGYMLAAKLLRPAQVVVSAGRGMTDDGGQKTDNGAIDKD